jgi:hypothetical protein
MNPLDSASLQVTSWQRWALLASGAGLVLAAIGLILDPAQFLRSYLYGYLVWTGMGIGCLGILLMHHTVGGKWGMVIRRMAEAGARTVPFMFVLLIPILVNLPRLYIWARPEGAADPNIQSKQLYLNIPFFLIRTVVYFAVWTFYAWWLGELSAEQDRTGDDRLMGRMRAISAPGLVLFTFVSTFAFIDWIMSLEPRWFSTIYGAMFLIGQMLGAFGLLIALVIVLSKYAPLSEYVTPQHLHDLGNMMFAFMVLWAYLSFSQFLITWAGNLPEEIPWYLRRLNGGWGWVALAIVFFNFAAPFALLLMRGVKRHAQRLLKVCLLILAIRLVDVYWIVEPAFYRQQFRIHWMDGVLLVAIGGVWLSVFFWQLKSRPLVPLGDPRLAGAPRETVAF